MEETQLGQNCSPVPGSDNIGTIRVTAPPESPAFSFVTRESVNSFGTENFMLLNKIRNGQIIQIVFHQNKNQKNVKI